MYVLYYIGRCFHQKGEEGACPSFVHTNNSSSPPSLDLQWLLHYTESGFRRPDPTGGGAKFFSFFSLRLRRSRRLQLLLRRKEPSPNQTPAHYFFPPFSGAGKREEGPF